MSYTGHKLIDYANGNPFTQRGKTMKVTISDVARLAGVSTATVSHTINNTRYVSGETKEKVYQAIAELGYTPDASARSFRTFTRLMRPFTSSFTLSSPHRPSNSASSSSRVGSGWGGASSLAADP